MGTPTAPIDKLADYGSPTGTVILNRGDPAFSRNTAGKALISEAETHFIHLISYLLFAESVVLPSRYIIDGPAMAQVAFWSAPLLEAGIVVPERRSGKSSFLDVSTERGVGEISMRRAEFLDAHAVSTRSFQYTELSSRYVGLLTGDLQEGGAFRRVVVGGQSGKMAAAIDVAALAYKANPGVTPEQFSAMASIVEPRLSEIALKWAMARYYTTPMLFDASNTRELPEQASKLLVAGRVLDPGLPRFSSSAPVNEATVRIAQLIARMPGRGIATHHREYCEALLEVRRTTKAARKLFTSIRDHAALVAASSDLAADFDRELLRQMKVKTEAGPVFLISTSLIGAGAGFGAGLLFAPDPETQMAVAGGSAVVTSAMTAAAEKAITVAKKKRSAPWLLAMDRFEKRASK